MTERKTLTVEEAAALLGISRNSAYRRCAMVIYRPYECGADS
jgi:predicted DNA-binding transcriptional regulator AlpA